MIFDQVVTGFRLAYGDAQEYYNVTPDIATLGKDDSQPTGYAMACSGGAAFGFLCGPSEPIASNFMRYPFLDEVDKRH